MRFLSIIFIFITFLSCNKFVQVAPPETEIEQKRLFIKDADALAAASGVYEQLTAYGLTVCNGAATYYAGLSADELVNTDGNVDAIAFGNNTLTADNSVIGSNFWSSAYKSIYQTNAVLEGLTSSATLSSEIQRQLTGEMLFTRSLLYFYIVNFFGDAPLILSTDYNSSGAKARVSADSIYAQIKLDLEQSVSSLRTVNASGTQRPSASAAAGLLARAYLYRHQWQSAIKQSSYVIDSGAFILEPDLNNVFRSESLETIFQLSRPNNNTAEAQAFLPYASFVVPSCVMRDTLLNSFEISDKRKNAWTQSSLIDGRLFYYPYKYKSREFLPVTEYYVILRLAEQYLIRAEARLMTGDIPGALSDLNKIRNRAGLTSINTQNTDIIEQSISKERRIEFFAEWGHRWLDVKRWDLCDQILAPLKTSNWSSSDTLYPIPIQEIRLNPLLTQNPGY